MNLESIQDAVRTAIFPLQPAGHATTAARSFLFDAKHTEAGRQLPEYYLVYFLLVDLLGFKNLGRFDKVAWSVPVELQGRAFLIEHRKFGVGVFAAELPEDEPGLRKSFAWSAMQSKSQNHISIGVLSRPYRAQNLM